MTPHPHLKEFELYRTNYDSFHKAITEAHGAADDILMEPEWKMVMSILAGNQIKVVAEYERT